MKDALNILSIDFDYFQKVDPETLYCYPDGHDFGAEMSMMIWAGHYANKHESEKILKVEVDTDKIEKIKRIIKKACPVDSPVMICNSHKHAYQFIKQVYSDNGRRGRVHVYNVDMHHDLFNNNLNVDCGNWVSHILKDIPKSTITWIANPISRQMYGLDESRFSMVSEDLSTLDGIQFDALFICRSDIWTPPHLDSYFRDLANAVADHMISDFRVDNVWIEDEAVFERDCTPMIDELKHVYDMIELNERH